MGRYLKQFSLSQNMLIVRGTRPFDSFSNYERQKSQKMTHPNLYISGSRYRDIQYSRLFRAQNFSTGWGKRASAKWIGYREEGWENFIFV